MAGRWIWRFACILGLAVVLDAAAAAAQTEVEITAPSAPPMGGSEQSSTGQRPAHFVVEQTRGDWLLVPVRPPQGAKRGGIERRHTRELFLPPREPLEALQNITLEQCQQAATKLGLLMNMDKWPEAARAAEVL